MFLLKGKTKTDAPIGPESFKSKVSALKRACELVSEGAVVDIYLSNIPLPIMNFAEIRELCRSKRSGILSS
jgi:hypothetical protein